MVFFFDVEDKIEADEDLEARERDASVGLIDANFRQTERKEDKGVKKERGEPASSIGKSKVAKKPSKAVALGVPSMGLKKGALDAPSVGLSAGCELPQHQTPNVQQDEGPRHINQVDRRD